MPGPVTDGSPHDERLSLILIHPHTSLHLPQG